jgi:hypothetical protein
MFCRSNCLRTAKLLLDFEEVPVCFTPEVRGSSTAEEHHDRIALDLSIELRLL